MIVAPVKTVREPSWPGRASLAVTALTVTALVVAACGGESPTPTAPTAPTTPTASVKVASVTLRSESVTGGDSVEGVVTLTGPAAATGLTVTLSSDVDVAALPATVVIAAGQSTGTFAIETRAVNADAVATVRASLDGEAKSAELLIKARALPRMVLKLDGSFIGGQTTPGAVELDAPAPDGGMTITLVADTPALIIPPVVTIPAGGRVTTFSVQSRDVSQELRVTVTAHSGSQATWASLFLRPVSFFSYESANGDIVGQGRSGKFTSYDTPFNAYVCDGHVSVFIQPAKGPLWALRMGLYGDGDTLAPGSYEGAPFDFFKGAWLAVDQNPVGCLGPTYGRFVVKEAVYGSRQGEILRFRATFEQRCKGNAPALTGEISVHSPPISRDADFCR
jgi:hypothetical protein